MFAYGSSLRAVSAEVSLERAQAFGAGLGITRVTDITRLDRPGIPVCVSIRPSAQTGSLCVNAGKGLTALEARVGAWMEAIEYALAEPHRAGIPLIPASARHVLDGSTRADAILDFCPLPGVQIPLDAPLTCVEAQDLLTGKRLLVPAELVFLPAPPDQPGNGWFGASSGGLASGNTLEEATLHALAELLEHDIYAFHLINPTSHSVRLDSLPPVATNLVQALRQCNLAVELCYQPNGFDLPFFVATIQDADSQSPLFYNAGFGCHPHRSIAVIRALCEAAQSRLSFIHGSRDDLTDWQQRTQIPVASSGERARLPTKQIPFEHIPDHSAVTTNIESCLAWLIRRLLKANLHYLLCVRFTAPKDPVQVVRIVVPGLESYSAFSRRAGRRLLALAERVGSEVNYG